MARPADSDLARLAAAHGVATWYLDGDRRRVDVDASVVARVLDLLGVDPAGPPPERAEPPATLVLRAGTGRALPGPGVLRLESGESLAVDRRLPDDLPLGYHRLDVDDRRHTVLVTPHALAPPPATWGWQLQLYALHSAGSWGIGDLADLREFTRRAAGTHGADAVLVNPLHAITPTHPVQPSPYTPSARRYVSPLALRITELAAYARADASVRAQVDSLAVPAGGELIDHDSVWMAKSAALELLWRADGTPTVPMTGALREFATFSALAERYGGRWRSWPARLHDPHGAGVAAAAADLAHRVAFHAWVQAQCTGQLAAVRAQAQRSGMRVGVVHDLAVGVDPDGADAWALQNVLATGVTIGAPPDAFSQQGQDWNLPPWRPDRLAATGYAAWRDTLRAVLAHADGLRIDHVAGLWRLWWIPPGEPPSRGTYVHYDADAMLGVLALEAHRAAAVIIGEDLGTVEPEVTEGLAARQMLGCEVLWFARDAGGGLRAPQRWPTLAAASLSTHDLPTAYGMLRGEQVTARAELGLLDDVAAERRDADLARAELLGLLRDQDLLAPDASEEDAVLAMHRLLARTPCRLLLASPYDALGVLRQPNLPGTVDEYPNWRMPLPVGLDEMIDDPRVRRIAEALRRAR